MDDNYYMKMALQEAQKAYEAKEVPVGAVVVCKGRIIARAHNLTETLTDVTAHAEMQAITAAASLLGGKYLNECTLYVTVEPCVMCAGAIGWSQLGKLVYGATDEKNTYDKYVERFGGFIPAMARVGYKILGDGTYSFTNSSAGFWHENKWAPK